METSTKPTNNALTLTVTQNNVILKGWKANNVYIQFRDESLTLAEHEFKSSEDFIVSEYEVVDGVINSFHLAKELKNLGYDGTCYLNKYIYENEEYYSAVLDKDGIEHYESLVFYEVDDFSIETYEKLATPIREEWKQLLTRDNIPCRIYCYGKNSNHEVSPELLK